MLPEDGESQSKTKVDEKQVHERGKELLRMKLKLALSKVKEKNKTAIKSKDDEGRDKQETSESSSSSLDIGVIKEKRSVVKEDNYKQSRNSICDSPPSYRKMKTTREKALVTEDDKQSRNSICESPPSYRTMKTTRKNVSPTREKAVVKEDNKQSHNSTVDEFQPSIPPMKTTIKIKNPSRTREKVLTTTAEENRASSSRPNVRPGPLSKKRKLEQLTKELTDCESESEVATRSSAETPNFVSVSSSSSSSSHSQIFVKTDAPKRIVGPCPRSKKPKLELERKTALQISSEKLVKETDSVVSLPATLSISAIIQEPIEKTVTKKLNRPCPRSKKSNLELEEEAAVQISSEKNQKISGNQVVEKLENETDSVVSLLATLPISAIIQEPIEKTETKKLNRPCPRSKKTDFTKSSKSPNEKNSINSSFIKITDKMADLQASPTTNNTKYDPVAYGKFKENNTVSRKVEQGEERTRRKQIEVQPMTIPPDLEQSSTHRILADKLKDVLSQLQKETGTPENLEVIMNAFSTKNLQSFQQTFNNNKPLYLFELVLPYIWMDLTLHDLLQCRLVCSRWGNSVDSLLCIRPDREKTSDGDHEIDFVSHRPVGAFKRNLFVDKYNRQRFTCQLVSLQKVQSFYEKVKNHPRNPFVTRSIQVRASPELNEVEQFDFWMSVSELFRIHGAHIWHLQLDIQGYHSVSSTYKMIQRVLILTPNLRTLELLCNSMSKSVSEVNEISIQKPLPNLPCFQTLDLNGAKCPTSFSGMLMKQYANTIQNLRVSLYRWNEEDTVLIANLKELDITAMCSRENLSHLYSPLQSLQHLDHLTKLSLTVIVSLSTSKLFVILQHLKNLRTIKIILLEHVGEQICLQDDFSSDGNNESPPSLPQVNSLELTLSSSQKSFRFLKWFPSLQTLHLSVNQKYMSKDDISVKVMQDRIVKSIRRCILNKSAVHSSIWSSLSSLCMLTVALTDLHDKQRDFYFLREMCQNKL